ncbi:MAG: hypothetical protein A3B82_02000 [Methylophilales bacterium RIFCSPHIGHO2_02_FULL_57_10]|nr:MAG: hypothetical protein A3B82_02000 [Methylophilales bacterium RIFCSPHIGHO2_02_FULL_57_10]
MNTLIQIWRAYRQCPIGSRLRVLGRYVLCPYSALLGLFPRTGRILDVGCGDGLLLFLLNVESESQARMYAGIDPAADKIKNARLADRSGAEFTVGDVGSLASASYDCVAIMDVLYLMPQADWPKLLDHAVRVLNANGLLIVKEVIDRPRWKRWLTYIEEFAAIKLLRMTQGQSPHFESLETYRAAIERAGTEIIRTEPVGAWRPAAHCLFVARKR